MQDKEKKILKKYEVEEALAKLLFYLEASINYKPYEKYKILLKKMLDITNKWMQYYLETENLLNMTDKEVDEIKELFNQISFDAYNLGDYFEEIEIWLEVVIYYGSCPVNQEYDESLIIRKGKVK